MIRSSGNGHSRKPNPDKIYEYEESENQDDNDGVKKKDAVRTDLETGEKKKIIDPHESQQQLNADMDTTIDEIAGEPDN